MPHHHKHRHHHHHHHQDESRRIVLNAFMGTRYEKIKSLGSGAGCCDAFLARMPQENNRLVVIKVLTNRVPSPNSVDEEFDEQQQQEPHSKHFHFRGNSNGSFVVVVPGAHNEHQEQEEEEPIDELEQINEIASLSILRHPNIVQLYDSWWDAGDRHLHLAMEFCERRDLETFLKKHGRRVWPLPERRWLWEWLRQLLAALSYMHSMRVVHRDLKLTNVLVTTAGGASDSAAAAATTTAPAAVSIDDEAPQLKIADFGLARAINEGSGSDFGDDDGTGGTSNGGNGACATTQCGSPWFFSPEIAAGAPHDFKTDVWSLGVVMFVLMTKRYPFVGNGLLGVMHAIRTQPLRWPEPTVAAAAAASPQVSSPNSNRSSNNNDVSLPSSAASAASASAYPIGEYSDELRAFVSRMLEKDQKKRPSAAELLASIPTHVQQLQQQPPHHETPRFDDEHGDRGELAASVSPRPLTPPPLALPLPPAPRVATPTPTPAAAAPSDTSSSGNFVAFHTMLLKFSLPKRNSNSNSNSNSSKTLKVNIRSSPALQSTLLGQLEWGDVILVQECLLREDGVWYRFSSDKGSGFCIATLQGRQLFGRVVLDNHIEIDRLLLQQQQQQQAQQQQQQQQQQHEEDAARFYYESESDHDRSMAGVASATTATPTTSRRFFDPPPPRNTKTPATAAAAAVPSSAILRRSPVAPEVSGVVAAVSGGGAHHQPKRARSLSMMSRG